MSFTELPEPVGGISNKILDRAEELSKFMHEAYTENAKAHSAVRPRLRVEPIPEIEEVVESQLLRTAMRQKGWSFKKTRSGAPGFFVKPITKIQNDIAKELGFIGEEE